MDKTKTPKNALAQFSIRLRKNLTSLTQLGRTSARAEALAGDARAMPLASNTVDLIVTSPPYANAIDYMRAHKFSLVWFGEPISGLSILRSKYIGSERTDRVRYSALTERAQSIVHCLESQDESKAAVLRKYYGEMQLVLSEMLRVLRPNSAAIVVIGTSIMRGIDVQTHYCLADLAANLGFDVVGIARRSLDRNKRMMPARFGKKTDSVIEQRMHEEYVVGLLKPDHSAGANHAQP